MSSSLPLDLELEIFGWSEKLITSNSCESYTSIVDKTITIAIFLFIYIYCLFELFFVLIISDLKLHIIIPPINLSNLSEFFVLPRLTIE